MMECPDPFHPDCRGARNVGHCLRCGSYGPTAQPRSEQCPTCGSPTPDGCAHIVASESKPRAHKHGNYDDCCSDPFHRQVEPAPTGREDTATNADANTADDPRPLVKETAPSFTSPEAKERKLGDTAPTEERTWTLYVCPHDDCDGWGDQEERCFAPPHFGRPTEDFPMLVPVTVHEASTCEAEKQRLAPTRPDWCPTHAWAAKTYEPGDTEGRCRACEMEAEKQRLRERLTTIRHTTVARLCYERDLANGRAEKAEAQLSEVKQERDDYRMRLGEAQASRDAARKRFEAAESLLTWVREYAEEHDEEGLLALTQEAEEEL